MHVQFQQENLRERDHLDDLDIGEIITLEIGV
jgi:hypothetical protein